MREAAAGCAAQNLYTHVNEAQQEESEPQAGPSSPNKYRALRWVGRELEFAVAVSANFAAESDLFSLRLFPYRLSLGLFAYHMRYPF